MKQYDPKRGWVDVSGLNAIDSLPDTGARERNLSVERGQLGSLDDGSVNPEGAEVFHFGRDGRRLSIAEEDPKITGAPGVNRKRDALGAMASSKAGDLLAISNSVAELFSTLAENETLSPKVCDVVEGMRCLSVKLDEKKRLEEELAAVTAQIVIVEQVLHRHVREARDSEVKELEVCQARVQLMRELADSILGDKSAQKPA